jgi:hypothetical protein
VRALIGVAAAVACAWSLVAASPLVAPVAAFGSAGLRPSLFVAPQGNDAGRCTRLQPCASFGRAYAVASPGASVEVAPGSYPSQVINERPKASGPDVVFKPASPRSVTLTDLEVTNGSYIEFRDFKVTGDTYNRSGARFVTYRRITMSVFLIRGADHIRYLSSNVGPNDSNDYMNWISAAYETSDPATDVVLDDVRIHDFSAHNSASHVDCIGVDDVDGLVIRNSRIWDCEHFAIIFSNDNSSDRAARNVLVENTFIDCCRSGYYAIGFGGIDGPVLFRFNSMDSSFGWLNDESLVPDGLITIDSNVLNNNTAANCERATWRYNVVARGTPCGGRHAPTGFRSPPADLHLVSSAAARRAGNPRAFPARDIDGNRRLKGHRPDAGADQVR